MGGKIPVDDCDASARTNARTHVHTCEQTQNARPWLWPGFCVMRYAQAPPHLPHAGGAPAAAAAAGAIVFSFSRGLTRPKQRRARAPLPLPLQASLWAAGVFDW